MYAVKLPLQTANPEYIRDLFNTDLNEDNMQINLSGHHLDITPALRSYVATKLHRIERHFDNVITAHVVLTVEKERKKAEATIHVNRANLFADARHNDMYAAIDRLIDKLDRQVKKHKEKLSDHRG